MQPTGACSRPAFAAAAFAAAAFVLTAALPMTALCQAWPAKPVRWVVPFSSGGVADIPAPIVGQRLSKTLGQQVVI
jgi:tripartite-type tricarboxylate transporter receptor subunit TctC